jgi:hypothetical protein
MEPLEKLEMIIRGELANRKKERERANNRHGLIYVQTLDNQISMLDWVVAHIDMIKRNAFPVSDELVMKMYGPSKTE